MSRGISRRRFLERSAATVAGVVASPYIASAQEQGAQPPATQPASKKLNIAFVGTGGRAQSHIGLAEKENCVAYCDVDPNRYGKLKELAPNAKAYTDWREMFDKHKDIEAVIVTTPDHSHAAPSMRAIKSGIHVYTEKPLTWSVDEARKLAEAAAERKVVTQMGNQGHANEGNRLIVEWIRAGAIGDVLEVHTWTNRPVWPQGDLKRTNTKPMPEGLNWDAWIGPAQYREYHDNLAHFNWRGWFDFGCGAVGDMGCHTWDNVFWSMNPDYPSRVKLIEIKGKGTETFPSQSHFVWEFPEKNGRPAFIAHWYSGGMKPETPEEFKTDPTRQKTDDKGNPITPTLPGSGNLYIGTKGKLLVEGDYGDRPRLIPETAMQEYVRPEKTIPRSPGHMNEFIMACKGEKPWDFPGSAFHTYAGPLTEVMLLGSLVEKMGNEGGVIECDPVKRVVLTKEAIPLLGREYRKGWEL